MEAKTGCFCFDEYGRPFLILQDEDKQDRLTGMEAIKSHILAARSVADKLRTSLGPKGMDKILVTPEGESVVTNDGATILELMDPENEVAKLMVSLAKAQDREVGDGTTGVVVLAGALLQEAAYLLDKGVHPTRISEGYQIAARAALAHLDQISFRVSVSGEDTVWLLRAAKTALSSKIASRSRDHLAEIVVAAFKSTCDLWVLNPVLNVNSIVLTGNAGGVVEDSGLIRGVVIKGRSDIKETLMDLKVAVFPGSALQLPKVHTRHHVSVDDMTSYNDLKDFVKDWWAKQVVEVVNKSGTQFLLCSNKMEETLYSLLLQNGIHVVENVADIEMVAALVGAHVVSKAEELSCEKLGKIDQVRVLESRDNVKSFALEQNGRSKIVTIEVCGTNQPIVEEVKRSLQDAICVVRNLIKDSAVVCGGGAAEISCSVALQQQSLSFSTLEQLIFQAFAEALDSIPYALAENAGLYPLEVISELKVCHKPTLGVDCMSTGDNDMLTQGVVEGLQSKKHQIVMATQLAAVVLKIDDIRGPKDQIKK
ncbi:T-complex protein 1 subunit epsilon-like isoform X2 [Macrosteles quadrilineatus]|uniref:T-complex protein 1 subunit epsilon-like isoform X2 n=1 Tax=Macrosteles quadrilineatus TaxID=74068 RepID=UPI0023E2FD92|nr:T-complex protein 1 subunit epsilon-like isoform X2 [Macrosteles quadrilineatus]